MKQVLQLSKVGLCGIVISCDALVGDVDVDLGPRPSDEGATAGAALPPLPSGPGSEADPSAIEGSECATGSFRCRGAQLDYCDGVHWLVWQACVSAALCESEPAGRCLPPACSIEQRRCSGAVFEGCNADATAWTTLETCESSAHCDAGTGCLTATCQEAQTRCNDGRVEVCQADDRGWSAVEECASAALCKEDLVSRAACAEPACDASEFRCAADGTGLVCNADRTGFVRCAGDDVPCTSECRQSETPPQDLPLDDVGSDGEGATAAEPAMPVCTFGPFQAAVRLTDDPAADYWSPSVTSNNLTVYFGGSRVGQAEHIFSTTRPSVDAQFIETTLTPGVNSPAAEGTAVESFDGLRLYFYSTRAGGQGDRDIWVATRTDRSDAFGQPSALDTINSEAMDHLPWLSRDERMLVFSSARAGGEGSADVWFTLRESVGEAFGTPVPLVGVNTSAYEGRAALTADRLSVVFASNRQGGQGDIDLWIATRPSADAPFELATNLGQLNSERADVDPFLSDDGRDLFFASDRRGRYELWQATRSCE